MPSSTDERRARMNDWFGDPVDDTGPIHFLISRGYTPTKEWGWKPPVSQHTSNFCEMECIIFLIEEWDWDGIIRT